MKQSKSNQGSISAKSRRRIRQREKKKILRSLNAPEPAMGSGRQTRGEKSSGWSFGWEKGKLPTPWGLIEPGNIKISGRDQSMVGLAERTDDIQVVLPRVRTESGGPFGTMDVIGGTEFLLSVNNPSSGSNPGDILSTILINPSLFTQTRLYQFALLYQRYRFRHLNFWFKPIANATQSGQLIGFADYDPDNILTGNGAENISIAAAHLGQMTGKIWETTQFPFGIVDDYTSLFVDADASELRLAIQGVFYLLAASEISSDISALGNIYVDYQVEFYIPLLLDKSLYIDQQTLAIEGGGSKTASLPQGTAPVSYSTPLLPKATLSFSTADSAEDVYYDTATGVFTLNVAEPNDVWYIDEYFNGSAAYGTAGTVVSFNNSHVPQGDVSYQKDPFSLGLGSEFNITNGASVNSEIIGMGVSTRWYVQCNSNYQTPLAYQPGLTFSGVGAFSVTNYFISFTKIASGIATQKRSKPNMKKLSLEYQRSLNRIHSAKAHSHRDKALRKKHRPDPLSEDEEYQSDSFTDLRCSRYNSPERPSSEESSRMFHSVQEHYRPPIYRGK